eukprot:6673568-Pyramimonas_sp.AAC.1
MWPRNPKGPIQIFWSASSLGPFEVLLIIRSLRARAHGGLAGQGLRLGDHPVLGLQMVSFQ